MTDRPPAGIVRGQKGQKMFDKLKPGDVIAKQEFDVVTPENETFRYALTLEKSGSFSYGNGTCLSVTVNGEHYGAFDTRYERGVVEDFRGWAQEWVYDTVRAGCLIYPIDPATGKREEPEE